MDAFLLKGATHIALLKQLTSEPPRGFERHSMNDHQRFANMSKTKFFAEWAWLEIRIIWLTCKIYIQEKINGLCQNTRS